MFYLALFYPCTPFTLSIKIYICKCDSHNLNRNDLTSSRRQAVKTEDRNKLLEIQDNNRLNNVSLDTPRL